MYNYTLHKKPNQYILIANNCDRACENRPCELKKSPIFSVFAVS